MSDSMADPTDRTSMDDLTAAVARAVFSADFTVSDAEIAAISPAALATYREIARHIIEAQQAVLRERGLLLGPDGLLRAEEVARMGWEPYDEAEDVPCPQWVGPYDTLVDGQSLVALSPLDPPEDTP